MATMGRYCKAYSLQQLRGYHLVGAAVERYQQMKADAEGKEGQATRPLTDDDLLYLQENYVVTEFIDENIVFDRVTPEWIAYCKEVLEFDIPEYDETTERLVEGDHPVVTLVESAEALKKAIDSGYVPLAFPELDFMLGKLKTNNVGLRQADFDKPSGVVHLAGGLTLNYVKVRCIADIDIATLQGNSHLEML